MIFFGYITLREKCPNTKYLSVFSPNGENTAQNKLRIWTLFMKWMGNLLDIMKQKKIPQKYFSFRVKNCWFLQVPGKFPSNLHYRNWHMETFWANFTQF